MPNFEFSIDQLAIARPNLRSFLFLPNFGRVVQDIARIEPNVRHLFLESLLALERPARRAPRSGNDATVNINQLIDVFFFVLFQLNMSRIRRSDSLQTSGSRELPFQTDDLPNRKRETHNSATELSRIEPEQLPVDPRSKRSCFAIRCCGSDADLFCAKNAWLESGDSIFRNESAF